MDGRIVLNTTEQRRIIVLNHLESGALVNAEAARLLGISKRQLQRLHKAYSEQGAAGLAHGNRGRPANNAIDAAVAARVVELAKAKYQGFNQQHLTEMLAENHGIELSRPTVRQDSSCGWHPLATSPTVSQTSPAPGPLSQGRHAAAAGRQSP